jgi:hypothetical protein
MAGPFKLRSGNSPLFKTMGSSPVKQEKKQVGPVVEKKKTTKKEEFIKTDVNPYTSPNPNVKTENVKTENGEVEKEGKGGKLRNLIPHAHLEHMTRLKQGTDPVVDKTSEGGLTSEQLTKTLKSKKGTWFGLPDFGVTETTGKIIDYFMPKR